MVQRPLSQSIRLHTQSSKHRQAVVNLTEQEADVFAEAACCKLKASCIDADGLGHSRMVEPYIPSLSEFKELVAHMRGKLFDASSHKLVAQEEESPTVNYVVSRKYLATHDPLMLRSLVGGCHKNLQFGWESGLSDSQFN